MNKQLDILHVVTFGATTCFTKRSSDSICYMGQVNYYLQKDKSTLLSAGILCGPDAVLAAPGRAGDFATVVELRVRHNWNKYFTQMVQAVLGSDRNVPGIGTATWYGVYTLHTVHTSETLDINFRAEWFDDTNGTRTGFKTNYEEVTLGLDYHPSKWISFRPEVRDDFSNNARAFNNGKDGAQFTAAFEVLLKF